MSLRVTFLSIIALTSLVGISWAGPVAGTPTGMVSIDGNSMAIPPSEFVWNSADQQWEVDNFSFSTIDGELFISGAFVPDPSLVYTFGVTDFGAPSTFTFAMTQPITPTGPLTIVQGSISGGLTDFAGNGITLTPNPANGDGDVDGFIETQVGRVGPGAVPTINMGVDVGLTESESGGGPGAVYTYGPYNEGPEPGPTGIFNSMGVTTSFILSGNNDSASLTGFLNINTVPEPSTFAMLGTAGALMAAFGVRRRRARA